MINTINNNFLNLTLILQNVIFNLAFLCGKYFIFVLRIFDQIK